MIQPIGKMIRLFSCLLIYYWSMNYLNDKLMKRVKLDSSLRFSFSYLLLVLLLAGPLSLLAQVHTGDLFLGNQAAVDAFSFTEVTGKLNITGSDINNLNAFSSLTSVGGDLSIYSNVLLSDL